MHADHGCAICDPMRAQLVAVDENADDHPDLGDVAAETVAMLRKQVRHVRDQLDTNPDDLRALALANRAANTVAKVLESARKLQADAATAIKSMSFRERARLFVGWYAELPPPYRMQLREQLERFELEAAKPVRELSDAV
jgi:hypothetical protein